MDQPIELFRTALPAPDRTPPAKEDPLWQKAVQLEAVLFAQLLDSAGVGGLGLPGSGDGPERQFDSFLRQAQAEAVAASGTTGLAQMIYRELRSDQSVKPQA